MANNSKACTGILNEIISRFSRISHGEEKTAPEGADETVEEQETEEQFWTWFCKEIKNKEFKECFINSSREDYYGSLEEVRKQYESKCK